MSAPNVATKFAVIKTGGKQYRVSANDLIVVERLADPQGEPLGSGDQVAFGDVLMLTDGERTEIGAPVVSGAAVLGEIVQQKRSAKIRVFKKRRRSTYRRRAGHRQHQSVVRILEIAPDGLSAPLKRGVPAVAPVAAEAPAKAARAGKAAIAAPAEPVAPASAPEAAIAPKAAGGARAKAAPGVTTETPVAARPKKAKAAPETDEAPAADTAVKGEAAAKKPRATRKKTEE